MRAFSSVSGMVVSSLLLVAGCSQARNLSVVKDGKAVARIWHSPDGREAAHDLAKHIGMITGAQIKVVSAGRPSAATPAIVVGSLAFEMGLPDPPKSLSDEGYRILRKGNHLLVAGASENATFFAATHVLRIFGCRWFFDNPIGTVIPRTKTLRIGNVDIAEKPDFISRRIWGPNWRPREWTRRNRLGGIPMSCGHAWPRWFCTTDPRVQRDYTRRVIEQSRGKASVSISPPDGRGYCQCERCKALDDPDYREPSSNTVCVSDRYQEFYNVVARDVKKVNRNVILNHYAYADYSLPPRRVKDAPDNLCVWVAPIRFCRMHSMFNPLCESRGLLRKVIGDWMKVESKMGYREYNYNLAEVTVPFSKISIWREDIPWLHKKGCLGINLESLALWHIYGINTYLIARLAWDADADVEAVMDDFYDKFCGAAAPHVKAYWSRIDRAYRETDVHAGCFHAVHAVWTPQLIRACQADLDAAADAAKSELVRKRIAMFRMGLDNAKCFANLRDAYNRCDFVGAKGVYDKWLAHMDAVHAAGIHPVGEYKHGYVPRFFGKAILAGYQRVTGGRRLLLQLPDEWLFRYDPDGKGETMGWHRSRLGGTRGWQKVRTYSATLGEQGIDEKLTWMWYRTTFRMPGGAGGRPLHLWLMELDGYETTIYIDGQIVGEFEKVGRKPVEVDITGKVRPGRVHTIAIKTNHRKISELALGGILKPIMIYSGERP